MGHLLAVPGAGCEGASIPSQPHPLAAAGSSSSSRSAACSPCQQGRAAQRTLGNVEGGLAAAGAAQHDRGAGDVQPLLQLDSAGGDGQHNHACR